MPATIDSDALDSSLDIRNLLHEPEHEGLLRLTKVIEHLFRVPAAYVALLGPDLTVVTRIGSGREHWRYLKTYPMGPALAKPQIWPDPSGAPAGEFISGDLKFAAAAPLRSSDGLELGLLVIADVRPRPDFSQQDHETLVELAGALAGKMELRMIACQARESELSLQEAERRFRSIANSAPVPIVYSGADGSVIFVNNTWLEFTGRSLDEELGEGLADTFHPGHRDAVVQAYWEAFQEGKPIRLEFPVRRHDGEYRWMLASGMPRTLDDGARAGYIGCFVDMTEQRSAIFNVQKQRLCMEAIAEASGAIYLILDPEGRIAQASPGCQNLFVRDLESMKGRLFWEAWDGTGAESGAIREAILKAASGRATAQGQTTRPAVSGGGDGAELLWSFTPIVSERDQLIAVTATVIELSGPKTGTPIEAATPGFAREQVRREN